MLASCDISQDQAAEVRWHCAQHQSLLWASQHSKRGSSKSGSPASALFWRLFARVGNIASALDKK